MLFVENTQTNVKVHEGRHEVLERHRVAVQYVTKDTVGFITIAKSAVEQRLSKIVNVDRNNYKKINILH
jgi:predicted amino acid racemase